MATITPGIPTTVEVGNGVSDLSGIDGWVLTDTDNTTFFTLRSPFDEGEGTELIFRGTFTGGVEGQDIGTIEGSIESIEIYDTEEFVGSFFTPPRGTASRRSV